jgi:hypothetical protein
MTQLRKMPGTMQRSLFLFAAIFITHCVDKATSFYLKANPITATSRFLKLDAVDSLELQKRLVSALPTKINDGAARSDITKLVTELEISQQKSRTLSFPSLWNDIDGDWTLKYTNNLRRGSEFLPPSINPVLKNVGILKIDSVIQRINHSADSVEHILRYSGLLSIKGEIKLKHSVEVTSDATPAQLAIDLEEVSIEGSLNPLGVGPIRLPGPSFLRRGYFEVSVPAD